MARLSKIEAKRKHRREYEQARRQRIRAATRGVILNKSRALGPSDSTNQAETLRPTPRGVIGVALKDLEDQLDAANRRAQDAQDELTRVLSVGRTGKELADLVLDVSHCVTTLRRLGFRAV